MGRVWGGMALGGCTEGEACDVCLGRVVVSAGMPSTGGISDDNDDLKKLFLKRNI